VSPIGESSDLLDVVKSAGADDAASEEGSDSFLSFRESGGSASDAEGVLVVVGSELSPSHTDIVKSVSNEAGEDEGSEETGRHLILPVLTRFSKSILNELFTTDERLECLDPDMLLYKAARAGNVRVMLEALALGANKHWINYNDGASTPLHQAVLAVTNYGDFVIAGCISLKCYFEMYKGIGHSLRVSCSEWSSSECSRWS